MSTLASAAANAGPPAGAIAGIVIGLLLYFLPTFISLIRNVPHTGNVIAINFFLGWTLVFWVIALAMAVRTRPEKVPAPQQQAPPPQTYQPPGR